MTSGLSPSAGHAPSWMPCGSSGSAAAAPKQASKLRLVHDDGLEKREPSADCHLACQGQFLNRGMREGVAKQAEAYGVAHPLVLHWRSEQVRLRGRCS